jgi:hypothetical protein
MSRAPDYAQRALFADIHAVLMNRMAAAVALLPKGLFER